MFRNLVRAALVAALGITAVPASAKSVFSSFVAFGDSLSDNGNLFAVTGQPPAPYDDGRFSNGAVWAEYIAAQFAAEGKLHANFAFGGAKARTDADGIPDLAAQLGLFATNVPKAALGKRPLAALWFGANDLLNLTSPADIAGAASKVGQAIKDLTASHNIRDFIVVNMPNLGVTPRATQQGTLLPTDPAVLQAVGLAGAFNLALANEVAMASAPGRRILTLDAFGLSNVLAVNPGALDGRLTTVATSCIAPGAPLCDLSTEGEAWAFFDEIHPNFVVHQVLGGRALDQINAVAPIPLPAPVLLLGAALLGLGALRRSHRV